MLSLLGSSASSGSISGYKVDAYTKILLHFGGNEGSTTFKDETGRIWTPSGSAKITKADSKFGNSCAYFDGTDGCCITTPDNEDFNLGTQNFTIDFWMKMLSFSTGDASNGIFGQANTSGSGASICLSSNIVHRIDMGVGDESTQCGQFSLGEVVGTWIHVAIVRNGVYIYVYKDGTSVPVFCRDALGYYGYLSAYTLIGSAIKNVNGPFIIGRNGNNNPKDYMYIKSFNGYIDEFRVSLGIARWTSNFTPPTF